MTGRRVTAKGLASYRRLGKRCIGEKSRTGRFVDTGKRDVNRRVVASGGKLQPWSVRAGKKISRESRYGDARRPARFFGGL